MTSAELLLRPRRWLVLAPRPWCCSYNLARYASLPVKSPARFIIRSSDHLHTVSARLVEKATTTSGENIVVGRYQWGCTRFARDLLSTFAPCQRTISNATTPRPPVPHFTSHEAVACNTRPEGAYCCIFRRLNRGEPPLTPSSRPLKPQHILHMLSLLSKRPDSSTLHRNKAGYWQDGAFKLSPLPRPSAATHARCSEQTQLRLPPISYNFLRPARPRPLQHIHSAQTPPPLAKKTKTGRTSIYVSNHTE